MNNFSSKKIVEDVEPSGADSALDTAGDLPGQQDERMITAGSLISDFEECEGIPEKFLEEKSVKKKRKRKGCLYKYLEKKRLKNGSIVEYPRVNSDRDPDNPRHWRWGYNWEEKIRGEWKGRSIGSIPIGAVPLIRRLQAGNVEIEEIIRFIKRTKTK